jgi:TolA-binding protein
MDEFIETAFVGEVISHILDLLKTLHGTAINAIHTSRNQINPDVGEALKGLHQNYEYKKSLKDQNEQEKPPLQPYDPNKSFQKKINNVKGPSINNIQQAHHNTYKNMHKQIKHIIGKVQTLKKQTVNPRQQQKTANKPFSKVPSNPGVGKALQAQNFIAKKTIQIKVNINGKVATTTITKGSPYSTIKTKNGVQLKRRGQRGIVYIAPSQLSRLA